MVMTFVRQVKQAINTGMQALRQHIAASTGGGRPAGRACVGLHAEGARQLGDQATSEGRPASKIRSRATDAGEPGIAAAAPVPAPTPAPASLLRPVVLGHGELDHLVLTGADETLCGLHVHSSAYETAVYDGRRACRACRRVANERGLKVRQTGKPE